MSQIASFYLLKDGRRQELSNGDCSGAVYMAIWDWCESELDLDVRFPAPQTEDTLDCALLEGELASQLLAALREQDLPELAAEIAPDWDLPTEAVHLGQAEKDTGGQWEFYSGWDRVTTLARAYAKKHARRGIVLFDCHTVCIWQPHQ